MIVVADPATLDPSATYWVPAVVATGRGWAGLADAHRGSRYLVDADTCRPVRRGFPAFPTRAECLRWIMAHRGDMARSSPDATPSAVRLDRWLLGTETI